MTTAQELIKNEANNIIEEFKQLTYGNSEEILRDYNNDQIGRASCRERVYAPV